MYKVSLDLTVDNIFRKCTSYDIFKKYCIDFREIGKPFHSPFRVDKHPSAFIIYYNGDFLFKDFGGESLRAISFVSKLFNLTFPQTLEKINVDFGLGLNGVEEIEKSYNSKIIVYDKLDNIIKIKKRNWEQKDIDYWNQYYISLTTLKLFNVFPISHYSINGYIEIADEYAYSYDYYWENGIFRRKIYQPYNTKGKKWINNGGKVVQGEGMLPKSGDLLIITSSLKDVMTLYELGYIAIAPTSETSFVPEQYFEKQSSRFQTKLLFFDSDETGIRRSKELSEKWGINYILIERINEKDPKDISDYIRKNGRKNTEEMVKQILSKI